jgi:hypothetical protein
VAYTRDLARIYRLNIDKIDNRSTSRDMAIFVEIPKNLTILDGDILEFTGQVTPTIHFPLRNFDRYAFYQGIYGKVTVPSFHRIPHGTMDTLDTIQK